MAKLNNQTEETKEEVEITSSSPSTDELLKIIQSLQSEISSMKAQNTGVANNVTPVLSATEDNTSKLLEVLANKKSDREVTIIHNREMLGGLSTHLNLQGASIDFHRLGEERVLGWQQFEECVSKYRKFFDEEIILLAPEHSDLVEKYDVPCANKKGNMAFNKQYFERLGSMDVRELEEFYNSLTENDQKFILSYWLGKAYEKDERFYDRYKMELLNRVSNSDVFDNMLTVMNSEFARKKK